VWVATYQDVSDFGVALAVSPDGTRVYVTGAGFSYIFHERMETIAYDALTGAQLWVRLYMDGRLSTSPRDIAINPDAASLYITGTVGGTDTDIITVAYDALTGRRLAVDRYRNSDVDLAESVLVSPDGSQVFVIGELNLAVNSQARFLVNAYDPSLSSRVWTATYLAPYAFGAFGALDPSGSRLYVTGSSGPDRDHSDYTTVAYDAANGAQQWVSFYDGGDDDFAKLIATARQGTVVVVSGDTVADGEYEYTTVALRALTGEQLRVDRYQGLGAGSEYVSGIAVSPDGGRVFVTGTSPGVDGLQDFATIAYGER
jgi:DNA-binding beta-propeller fold protein YncE